jgi:putative endonuclease
MYYVYLLKSEKSGQWYTGSTGDLRKRLSQHNTGKSTWTKRGIRWTLIYYEACHSRDDAYAREKYLKTGAGKKYLKNRLKRFLSVTG